MKNFKFDLGMLALSAALYVLGKCWLQGLPGAFGTFCRFYWSDILAGILILAVLNSLLYFSRYKPIRTPLFTVPFLLACGLVWEFLAPLWKPGAAADLWDFLAYQAGGALYLLFSLLIFSIINKKACGCRRFLL